MKKLVLLIAAGVFLTGLTSAFASQTVEAFISKSAFDGKTLKYSYIAYDTDKVLSQNAKTSCQYSLMGDGQILSSVEVKVYLEADFSKKGQQVAGEGKVDVRRAIETCLMDIPGGLQTYDSPVEVKLPRISVPSRM